MSARQRSETLVLWGRSHIVPLLRGGRAWRYPAAAVMILVALFFIIWGGVPWLATLVSVIVATVTAWMAVSTAHMAKATRETTSATANLAAATRETTLATQEATKFAQGVERVRLLIDLLEMYETKVLARSHALDVATGGSGYRGPTGRSAPGVDPFHHPDILTRLGIDEPLRGDKTISPVEVLNGVEQFATALVAGEEAGVWDMPMLSRLVAPTRNSFVEVVNDNYDVVCHFASRERMFPSLRLLYAAWETAVADDWAENMSHNEGVPHEVFIQAKGFRFGFTRDYSVSESDVVPCGPGKVIRVANGETFLWVQFVGESDKGLGGYLVTISVSGTDRFTFVEGRLRDVPEAGPKRTMRVVTNTTGTLSMEFGEETQESTPLVSVIVWDGADTRCEAPGSER